MLREYFGQADTTDNLWAALKAIPSEVFEVREEEGKRQVKRKQEIMASNEGKFNLQQRMFLWKPPFLIKYPSECVMEIFLKKLDFFSDYDYF